jgi:hypothetical protein
MIKENKKRLPAPWLMASLAAVLAALLFLQLAVVSSHKAKAADAGLSVTTDKFVYGPGETINFSIEADSGGQSLTGDLVLRVYRPALFSDQEIFVGGPIAEAPLALGFNVSGAASAGGSVSIGDLNLGAGGYPARVVLVGGGQELLVGDVWLAVAAPVAAAPVDLVLLWTVGGPPQRNPQNEFISGSLVDRCRNEPRSGDSLLQHEAITRDYPSVKTTYAILPMLLDELVDISDGFVLAGAKERQTFDAASIESVQASNCIDSLRELPTYENVELLGTSFAFADLTLLAKEGWSDGTGQYRVGHDILTETLLLPSVPRGAYIPGLNLTTDSLRYVAATGGEYAVLAGYIYPSVEGRNIEGVNTFRLRDLSGERITSLFASDDVSQALLGDDPDPNAFFAGLVNHYIAGNALVITAAANPSPPITSDQRSAVYAELQRQPWINSITLAEAKDKYRPDSEPATLLRYIDPATGYITQTYYARMDDVHDLFEDYRAAVDTEEPQMVNLAKLMYTAENNYWFNENADPVAANRGLAYLDEVERLVVAEFEGLKIEVDTPLLQWSSSNKALVTIFNSNNYAFTVELSLTADEDVEFPEGAQQQLRVEGGVTQVEIPYESSGWSRIDADLLSRGNTVVSDSAAVRPMTLRVWITIIVLAVLLLGGVAYYTLVIKRG